VMMAEVVSFVHEVHLIHNGHGIGEIIFRMFRVTEACWTHAVMALMNSCREEEPARTWPQFSNRNKHSSEVSIVARHSPKHASSVLFIASRPKVGVGSEP